MWQTVDALMRMYFCQDTFNGASWSIWHILREASEFARSDVMGNTRASAVERATVWALTLFILLHNSLRMCSEGIHTLYGMHKIYYLSLGCKLFAVVAFLTCIGYVTASGQTKKYIGRKAKPIAVNIQAVCDSVLLMADDYATALQMKPEFSTVRLNALKNYYMALPTTEAKDSVRHRLFDFYVNYVEQNRKEQATAFRKCYMAIAPGNDENCGQILAADMAQSRIDFDTAAVSTLIPQLEDFANRNNLDYDEELAEARSWLHWVRTRKPIQDILPGVWVSERIAEFNEDYSGWEGLSDESFLPSSLYVLKIRNLNSPVYREMLKTWCFTNDSVNRKKILSGDYENLNLDVIKSKGSTRPLGGTALMGFKGIAPLDPYEFEAYNIHTKLDIDPVDIAGDTYLLETTSRYFLETTSHSKKVVTDDKAYGAYIFWGDERLKRGNPDIAAMGRQTVQTVQASVAGELSRSSHSKSEELAGNLITGFTAAGINAAIDALMVSKEKIWSVEVFVKMINPYKLKATIYCQLLKTASNSTQVKKEEKTFETYYYRWEPEDDARFMAPLSCQFMPGVYKKPILLHNVTKEQMKAYEKEMKDFYKQKEKEVKEELKVIESQIKKIADKSDRKIAESKFIHETYPYYWQKKQIEWNTPMLAKLKAKAENYKPE